MISSTITPELAVTNVDTSLAFYRELLGFDVEYERPKEGFAMISLDGARLMLDQIDLGRTFGENLDSKKLGAGVNFEISVSAERLNALLAAIEGAEHPLFLPLEERWYKTGDTEACMKQFIVADPDGYLLRFANEQEPRKHHGQRS